MAKLATVLKNLSKPLDFAHVEFRAQRIGASGNKVWAQLLAYKNARTDMEMLDKNTDGLWQNQYYRDSKGALVCRIGIKADDTEDFVWKEDCGTESFADAQKGEYSDAFKRAGFRWGIGRELYDYPAIFVFLNDDEYYMKNGEPKQTSKFRPNEWTWERDNKGMIRATDKNGVIRYHQK